MGYPAEDNCTVTRLINVVGFDKLFNGGSSFKQRDT